MTRRFPRWLTAVALSLISASAASAQMVPDMPPSPPAPPVAPTPAAPVAPPTKKAPAPVGVAAIVNGKKIFRYQVANEALKIVGPEQLLNQMILIELINEEAAKQAVTVTPAEIATRLTDTENQYANRVPGGFQAVLAQRGMTLATYTDQLKTEMKVEALVAKTLPPVTPTPRYHVRHLLIQTPNGPPPPPTPGATPPHTDAEAKALIAKAQADLKAGKSFVDVANQYTEDPSGKGKGGDLGLIDSTSQLVPAFLTAALALKPGQITPTPVKSEFGYHLIEMDSSSTAPLPADRSLYEQAAKADRLKGIQAAIPAYVQGLRKNAKIVDYLATP